MKGSRCVSLKLQTWCARGRALLCDERGAIKEGLAYVLMALFILTVGLGIASSASKHQNEIWEVFWSKLKEMFEKIKV